MRRPRTALIAAVTMTALSATFLGARQLRGQSAPPAKATPTIDQTRGVRYLLRNGVDYLDKYQDYDRALVYLRAAETRQAELDDAERQTLNQALQRALQGMRAVEGISGPTRAGDSARSRPGTIALAPSPNAIELPTPDETIQLVGGGATAQPKPAAASSPGEPSPMPEESGDVTIISAPPEPLNDALPVIEDQGRPEPAPLPPLSNMPEPSALPPLAPPPSTESVTRPEPPAPVELAEPPAPVELAPPQPEQVATPPELPPVIESEALVPAPEAIAEPSVVAEPAPAAAAVEPIVPIQEPAQVAARPEGLERPSAPASAVDAEDLPPLPPEPAPRTVSNRSGVSRNSLLSSELQREVEEVAQRLEQDATRRNMQRPEPIAPPSGVNDMAGGQLELPRAPSPTEARPLRAIPVPEEFVPLPKREWKPQRKYWAAAATGHGPLYFQDAALERYGQSVEQALGPAGRLFTYPLDNPKESQQRNQFLQPWYSIGKFAAQIGLLPYNLIVDPPWEAEWDLGYYRPGDRIPPDTFYIPTTGVGPPLRGRNY